LSTNIGGTHFRIVAVLQTMYRPPCISSSMVQCAGSVVHNGTPQHCCMLWSGSSQSHGHFQYFLDVGSPQL